MDNKKKLDVAIVGAGFGGISAAKILANASGAKHFYFGNNEWEMLAPGLKNIEQAIEIRRRILTAFELAEKETDTQLQQSYLTFVVIGGGPTGVELAGAIAEMAKNTLMRDYRVADLRLTKVYLIEAGPHILASFPIRLSLQAEKDLADLGVQVMKNTRACALTTHGLRAGNKWINCKTMIWAAGVKPASVFIFFQWAWGYFSFGHGARLITHRTWRFYSGEKLSYHDESKLASKPNDRRSS